MTDNEPTKRIDPRLDKTRRRVPCPECHKPIVSTYLTAHRRKIHGRQLRNSPAVQATTSNESSDSLQVATVTNSRLHFKTTPFVVLVDNNGDLWLAEKMGDKSR